ncbi:Type IV pilus biogenesis and competence protein PilQ precursor [Limihaloglobus sulfuriphilus]|uniref:Type IV pilus biogenesis and competence protein PilQ n=1 Tax=Limihaloglobus sulfuriphilus TaxID=1851148 RepID=A0A1Q2MI71_9BACT|nr:secretin N-terminal domain-containing protein [Limihaloglobus sulfuriphilus]AQQ71997.1 Type IV pilus biogenesis and competence protein PilQ precursor [Limihaloglobus sulfuriphilus]
MLQKKLRWFLVTLTAICCFSGILSAEEVQEQEKYVSELDAKLAQKITVDFSETPIEDVLRIVAMEANIDVVKSPSVTGLVNATLNNVPVGEVLDNILAVHNYGYIRTKNMIRVVPKSEMVDTIEKIISRVYRITYADVKEVEKAVAKIISKDGSVSANPGTSNIIVTDVESRIEAVDLFIDEVDRVTQQVIVEVRIYDVTDNENFNLDMKWDGGRMTLNSAGEPVAQSTGGGISYVDEVVPGGAAPGAPPAQGSTKRADPYTAGSFDRTNGGQIRLGVFNDSISIDMLFSMLHSQGYAKLLANPSIMVLDNETAHFEIVEEIPYKDVQESSGGGSMTTTEFKEVGVQLEVTPHITRDEMLRLHIMPEFGIAEEQERNPITNEPIVPTVHTRRLDTIALLQSGSTVILGGLKQYKSGKDYYKTPVLGDTPLIKHLFRSETESMSVTELLIFITPVIVKEDMSNTIKGMNKYEHTQIAAPVLHGKTRFGRDIEADEYENLEQQSAETGEAVEEEYISSEQSWQEPDEAEQPQESAVQINDVSQDDSGTAEAAVNQPPQIEADPQEQDQQPAGVVYTIDPDAQNAEQEPNDE